MTWRLSLIAILLGGLVRSAASAAKPPSLPAPSPVSVLTQRNDNLRSGLNLNERGLSTANVNTARFGKLFTRPVDGDIYAQPLYLPAVRLPRRGVRNVVYVATQHNSVYAFDADDPDAWAPLWHINLGPSIPKDDVGQNCGKYRDFRLEVGITSTPVIDPRSGTLYVLARTKDGSASYHQRLHALDIATGVEKFKGSVEITATVPGSGDGAVNGSIQFDPLTQNQRAALLLLNGVVYITWASHCDTGPYHGWVMGYNASTLRQVAVLNLTPNGEAGGIWQSGTGPAADARGNIYVTASNGTSTAYEGGQDYGECMLRLSTAAGKLRVADWFTPFDYEEDNSEDTDIGSCGSLLIPDADLMLTGNKRGMLYLARMNRLGGYMTNDLQIVQRLDALHGHVHGTPLYWNSPRHGPLIYVWSENDTLKAFRLVEVRLLAEPLMHSAMEAPPGMPGGFLSLSANGNKPGTSILWATLPFEGDANHGTVPGVLRAFDATDLSIELWNSRQNAERDDPGNFAKFCPPTVANGKVYLATFSNQLAVYGLKPPPVLPTPIIVPSGGQVGDLITLSCPAPGTTIRYTTDGSEPLPNSTLYTRPFALTECATVKTRSYRTGALESRAISALFTRPAPVGTGHGLTANYYNLEDLTGPAVTRVDATVNFDWPDGTPFAGIGPDHWSAQWTGFLQPRFTDTYTISTLADDGVRLYLNGKLLLDDWTYHDAAENTATVTLEAGKKYPIKLQFCQGTLMAHCQLFWEGHCQAKEIIPQSQLYTQP